MAGKQPTHDVVVATTFKGRDGKLRTKYCRVGSGWDNGKGHFNFSIVTMPGVSFHLYPKGKKEN